MPRARRLDALDVFALVAVACWCTWVGAAALLSGRPLSPRSPYLWAPLTGVAGVALGRFGAAQRRAWPVGEALLVVVGVFLLAHQLRGGAGALPLCYSNANATVGLQLLALAMLGGLAARGERPEPVSYAALPDATRRVRLAFLAGAGAVAVVAANNSVAGWALLLPVLAAGLWVRVHPGGPVRGATAVAAGAVVATAGAANVHLAARDAWPTILLRTLDAARKELWGDALALWSSHPLTGGGPGSFREASRLAADPDTATVHSSLLQVGSELGLVGVGLLAVLLATGLALALRRSRAAGLVAAVAWTALIVHSFVDHLFEFTAVTVAAGAVLGWASTPPLRVRQADHAVRGSGTGRSATPASTRSANVAASATVVIKRASGPAAHGRPSRPGSP